MMHCCRTKQIDLKENPTWYSINWNRYSFSVSRSRSLARSLARSLSLCLSLTHTFSLTHSHHKTHGHEHLHNTCIDDIYTYQQIFDAHPTMLASVRVCICIRTPMHTHAYTNAHACRTKP